MSMADDLGYLADRASRFDLSIASLEVQAVGYPMVVGVGTQAGRTTRERELRAWLEQIQPEGRCVLWGRGEQVRLNVRGVLTDEEGIGSILVNVFAVYNRPHDAAKVRVMRDNVETMAPAELLTAVEAA
jgi:hypothetical protein